MFVIYMAILGVFTAIFLQWGFYFEVF